jgi:endonuclease/exonuclease/phosphatase family metal-dependent hydrolase
MELEIPVERELCVISYNIFFGKLDTDSDRDVDNRIQLLSAQLQSLDADVICLQEVLPIRYARIRELTRHIYPYSYPDDIAQNYDTAIMSKHPFVKKSKIKFSVTSMGRSIQFVSIKSPFDSNKTIGIANSHLESEFGDTLADQNIKMIQYAEAEDILDQVGEMCEVSDIIFCGDFNSHNDLSDSTLYKYFKYSKCPNMSDNDRPGWRDAWIETGSDPTKENTFDSTTNPLMLELHSKLSYPPYYVSRLDRVIHRSSLHVHSFEMVTTNMPISDHYPITVIFKEVPPAISIDYVEYDPDKIAVSRTRVRKRASKSLTSKLKTVSLFK